VESSSEDIRLGAESEARNSFGLENELAPSRREVPDSDPEREGRCASQRVEAKREKEGEAYVSS